MRNLSFLKSPSSLVAVLTACVLAAGGTLLFTGSTRAADAPAATQARPTLTVTTAQPQRTAMPLHLSANGNVAAWQEASIGAESNGLRLTEVRVNVGDVVKAGQVLAIFATETVQADVAQARASLLEAQAHAAEAAANAERARTLQATGALSQQQIQQFTTGEKTAQARVEAAQALLQVQHLRLQHTQVRAPDSGVISARTATVGAVLGAGTELFRMVRKGRLEWRAEVLSTVAPTVDPQTRNALVYVDLPPMATEPAPGRPKAASAPSVGSAAHAVASVGAMLPGMFARGEFQLGSSDALTVPQEALVVRDGFSYVFVLGTDQRAQQRKVQTGRRLADRVEVLSGIEAQASIAVRGAGFLNDGDLVRVVAPDAGTSSRTDFKQKVAQTLTDKAQAAIH